MSGEVLLTQRGELVQELVLVARDRFFDIITQIYNKTKKKSPKKEYLLRNFQDELEEIPEWTPDDVFAESNPSFREVKREVTGLLTTIHELNNQLFPQSPVQSVDNRTHDTEQDHFQRFVKMAMIHIAREFWKMPYLMHSFHDKNDFTIKTEIDKIIVQAIKTTIRRQSTLTIVYEPERSGGVSVQPAPPSQENSPRAPLSLENDTSSKPEQEPRVPEIFNADHSTHERVVEQGIGQDTDTPVAQIPDVSDNSDKVADTNEENRLLPRQEVAENNDTETDSDESSVSTRSKRSVRSDVSDKKKLSKHASTEESADESEDVSSASKEKQEKKMSTKDDVELDEESQKETKPFSKQENQTGKKAENSIPLDILKQVLKGVVSEKKEKKKIKKPKKMKKGKGEKRKKEKKDKNRPISEADLKKYEKFFDPVDNV